MNTQKTGEFIKALRKENNLTQLELAKKLSCTDKAISRWETGKGLPDADMLLSLSETFSVSINEILLGERYSLSRTHKDDSDFEEKNPTIAEIITSTDETIVDILKEKEKEISDTNRSAIQLIVVCCIQLLIFFVIPDVVLRFSPHTEPIMIFIYGSLINFVLAGFIKDKTKWIFPFFNILYILLPVLFKGSDSYVYMSIAPICGVASAVIMGGVDIIRYIIKKLNQAH